jgi:hypothetical protein
MFPYGRGICYSGYRKGQSPRTGMYPTEDQVLEDLRLLAPHFDYLRMYDTSEHAESVFRVIERHRLPLKVMLGTEPLGEISNPNCPWEDFTLPKTSSKTERKTSVVSKNWLSWPEDILHRFWPFRSATRILPTGIPT